MNKVGRPVKYPNDIERTETRRLQNKENQRKCRLKKKVKQELNLIPISNKQWNKEYRNNLYNYINEFEFDYFFTGTQDPNHSQRELLKEMNTEINSINKEFLTEFNYLSEKRVGIKSLRKYTEKYIQFLNGRNLIERCFVVFEIGKNKKYHVHIMFKSNERMINFENSTENGWLMGTSYTLPITTEEDKKKIIGYSLKELNPRTKKQSEIHKVDNWFLWGDFERKEPIIHETQYTSTLQVHF